MNAQEAETSYRTIKNQFDSKQISQEEYNRRVSELRYQDNTGTWWAISPNDGSWLKWNGSTWVQVFAQTVQPPPAPNPQPSNQPTQQTVQQKVQPSLFTSTQIREYKRTCKRCGTIWHSLVLREKQIAEEAGKGTCNMCSGSNKDTVKGKLDRSHKATMEIELTRLRTCPKCQSQDYIEEVTSSEH